MVYWCSLRGSSGPFEMGWPRRSRHSRAAWIGTRVKDYRPMSTVAPAPSARTVRHGRTDLQLRIGATWYKLRTMPPPAGFRIVRTLKKLDPHGPPATYTVAQAKG